MPGEDMNGRVVRAAQVRPERAEGGAGQQNSEAARPQALRGRPPHHDEQQGRRR